jgi:hypothetical protein
LKFLAGNIAINKDENRKSSFMTVETPWEHKFKLRDGPLEGGEKTEKKSMQTKMIWKKIHASDLFKMREDIFLKKTYIHS